MRATVASPGRGFGKFMKAWGSKRGDPGLTQALQRVCKDECEDLLSEIRSQAELVLSATKGLRIAPFSETYSVLVVQKVESHLLGCCGQTCGWNQHTCAYWPCMRIEDQESWNLGCSLNFPGV